MISIRLRKLTRDLAANWQRTLLAVLAIALGVAALGGVVAAGSQLDAAMDDALAQGAPAQVLLETAPLTPADLAALQSVPGVALVEGRARVAVSVLPPDGQPRNLSLFALADYVNTPLSRVVPVAGAFPPPPGGLLIEQASLNYLGLEVGDQVALELADGRQATLQVAGVVYDPWQQSGDILRAGFAYVLPDALPAADLPITQVHIAATDPHSRAALGDLERAARELLEARGVEVRGSVAVPVGEHLAAGLISAVLLLLALFGGLALLLGGLLVANTMNALVAGQARQIGALKALGARRGQVAQLYAGLGVALGVLALPPAMLAAWLGAGLFSRTLAGLLNLGVPPGALPLHAVLLMLAAGLLAPLAAALLPARRAAAVQVSAALGAYGVAAPAPHRPFFHIGATHLPAAVRLGLGALRRRPGRFLFTLATLAGAGALIIAVLDMRAATTRTLAGIESFFQSDAGIDLDRSYPVEQLFSAAADVPGLVTVEPVTLAAGRIESVSGAPGQLVLWGVAPDTIAVRPRLLEGRWLRPDDGLGLVVSTYLLRDQPELRVGDTVTLVARGRTLELPIVGIIESAPNAIRPAPYGYVEQTALAAALGEPGTANRLELRIVDRTPEGQQRAAEALTAALRSDNIGVRFFITGADLAGGFRSAFAIVFACLAAMGGLIAIVGGLGLAGALGLGVVERTREIGVLRSLGASRRMLATMIAVEALAYGALSWLIAVGMGLPLGRLIAIVAGEAFIGRPFDGGVSLLGPLLWIVALTGLCLIAALAPAAQVVRLRVREALAYE